MIVASPLDAVLPAPLAPATSPQAPRAVERDRAALEAQVARLGALLGATEWHQETVTAAGVTIPHQLGRVPWAMAHCGQDSARIVFADWTKWTDREIYLQASAGTVTVRFGLF